MPKSLSHWNNRETTLYVGYEVYSGVVRRDLIDRTQADGKVHDTYLYHFQTKDGKDFIISARSVRANGSGLEIKDFRNFVPCFVNGRRNIH